jgi:hypothetical protein
MFDRSQNLQQKDNFVQRLVVPSGLVCHQNTLCKYYLHGVREETSVGLSNGIVRLPGLTSA